jgi:hypothetical protein
VIYTLCGFRVEGTADQSEWEVKDPAKDATTKFNNDETQCVLDPRCEILWFRPTEFDKLNIATPEESNKDFAGVRNGEPNLGKSYTTSYSPNRCSTTSDVMNPQIWWNYAREIVDGDDVVTAGLEEEPAADVEQPANVAPAAAPAPMGGKKVTDAPERAYTDPGNVFDLDVQSAEQAKFEAESAETEPVDDAKQDED